MRYDIAAHPTEYHGVMFRSRLEARWACLFDLLDWSWEYEPIDLVSWSPDFLIKQTCNVCGMHEMYAEVKPYYDIIQFKTHPIWKYKEFCAMLGQNPDITFLRAKHATEGGFDTGPLSFWYNRFELLDLWIEAGNRTQWKPAEAE